MAINKSGKGNGNGNGVTYETIERYVIAERSGGYKLELRFMSWNGNEPKYDLRTWKEDEDGEKCGKGIGLTGEELIALKDMIVKLDAE